MKLCLAFFLVLIQPAVCCAQSDISFKLIENLSLGQSSDGDNYYYQLHYRNQELVLVYRHFSQHKIMRIRYDLQHRKILRSDSFNYAIDEFEHVHDVYWLNDSLFLLNSQKAQLYLVNPKGKTLIREFDLPNIDDNGAHNYTHINCVNNQIILSFNYNYTAEFTSFDRQIISMDLLQSGNDHYKLVHEDRNLAGIELSHLVRDWQSQDDNAIAFGEPLQDRFVLVQAHKEFLVLDTIEFSSASKASGFLNWGKRDSLITDLQILFKETDAYYWKKAIYESKIMIADFPWWRKLYLNESSLWAVSALCDSGSARILAQHNLKTGETSLFRYKIPKLEFYSFSQKPPGFDYSIPGYFFSKNGKTYYLEVSSGFFPNIEEYPLEQYYKDLEIYYHEKTNNLKLLVYEVSI